MLLAFTLLSACELVGEEKNGIFWAVYVQRYIYHWILEIHTHIWHAFFVCGRVCVCAYTKTYICNAFCEERRYFFYPLWFTVKRQMKERDFCRCTSKPACSVFRDEVYMLHWRGIREGRKGSYRVNKWAFKGPNEWWEVLWSHLVWWGNWSLSPSSNTPRENVYGRLVLRTFCFPLDKGNWKTLFRPQLISKFKIVLCHCVIWIPPILKLVFWISTNCLLINFYHLLRLISYAIPSSVLMRNVEQ